MKDTKQKDVKVPEVLITVFDLFSEPIIIASADSKILYANQPATKYVGVETLDELIGRHYEEVQSPLYDDKALLQRWKEQDQQIINNPEEEITTFEVHPGPAEYPYTIKKSPLYNESKECVGIINMIKPLISVIPNESAVGKLTGSLLLNPPDDFFTEKECQLIFLKFQGMTNEAIASKLDKSPGWRKVNT